MSEKEEMAWSQKRCASYLNSAGSSLTDLGNSFEDVLEAEAPLLLPEADERVQTLKRVCDRLVTAMDAQGLVSAAIWPRDGGTPHISSF